MHAQSQHIISVSMYTVSVHVTIFLSQTQKVVTGMYTEVWNQK